MSEPTPAPVGPTPEATPDLSVLARQLSELLARDRDPSVLLFDSERPRVIKKREPIIPPRIRAALNQSLNLWLLFVINAVLLWASLVIFNEGAYALYVERLARILQLATIALLFDIWLHPLQHPDTLEGPAQGARQYQRIYTIAIFVVAGCLTP